MAQQENTNGNKTPEKEPEVVCSEFPERKGTSWPVTLTIVAVCLGAMYLLMRLKGAPQGYCILMALFIPAIFIVIMASGKLWRVLFARNELVARKVEVSAYGVSGTTFQNTKFEVRWEHASFVDIQLPKGRYLGTINIQTPDCDIGFNSGMPRFNEMAKIARDACVKKKIQCRYLERMYNYTDSTPLRRIRWQKVSICAFGLIIPFGVMILLVVLGIRLVGPEGPLEVKEDRVTRLIGDLDWCTGTEREEAMDELVKMGAPAVEPLIAALRQNELGSMRHHIIWALAEIGDGRAVPALIDLLTDNYIASTAANALGEIGDMRAFEPLREILENPDTENEGPLARAPIASVLVRLDPEKAVEPLLRRLDDPDAFVRASAASCLGELKEPRALEPLLKALDDPDEHCRSRTAFALGRFGDRRAVEPLIKHLKDETMRRSAVSALGQLADKKAVGPLRSLWETEDFPQNRYAIAGALYSLTGEEGFFQFIVEALDDQDSLLVSSAISQLGAVGGRRAIPYLVEALDDKDFGKRWNAVWALAQIKEDEALGPLIEALKDDDGMVRRSAASALKGITGENFRRDYDAWKEWHEKNKAK